MGDWFDIGTSILGSFSSIFNNERNRSQQKTDMEHNHSMDYLYYDLNQQSFENTKDYQQWQRDAWQKEFDYNAGQNQLAYDLNRNAVLYRSQDLVNAGMSPLLAAGQGANTFSPAVNPAPTAGASGSYGTGGNSGVRPGVNTDAFSVFADFLLRKKQLEINSKVADADIEVKDSQVELNRKLTDQAKALATKIEAETDLTRQQVLESISKVSNMDMQTLRTQTEILKLNKDIELLGEQTKNFKLSNEEKQLLIDYAKENGLPPSAIDSSIVRGLLCIKAQLDEFNAEGDPNLSNAVLTAFGVNGHSRLANTGASAVVRTAGAVTKAAELLGALIRTIIVSPTKK